MKKQLLFIILCCVLQLSVKSQLKGLKLNIEKLDASEIELSVNGNSLPDIYDELVLSGRVDSLYVTSKFKIVVTTLAQSGTSTTKAYTIAENKTTGIPISLDFSKGVVIKILSIDLNTEIKKFTIKKIVFSQSEPSLKQRNFYYDAFRIVDICRSNGNGNELTTILCHYAGISPDSSNYATLKSTYTVNPYLKEMVVNCKAIAAQSNIPDKAKNLNVESFSGAMSSIGGLDVTSFADGLAKFLVKRTKEEMNIAFFNRLKDFLTDTNYLDAKILFPTTFRNLSAIGNEIYQYAAYLETLRAGFIDDFQHLPDHFPAVMDNHPELKEINHDSFFGFKTACYISTSLREQEHVGNIIANLPDEYIDSLQTPNAESSIRLLQLFSEALRDTVTADDSKFWIKTEHINKLFKDQDVFKIFLGLIRQVATRAPYNSIRFADTLSLVKSLDRVSANINDLNVYKKYIKDFITKSQALSRQIKSFNKSASDSVRAEQYYTYFNSSLEIVEHLTKFNSLPYLTKIRLSDTIQDLIDITHCAGNIVIEVNRKNYSSALINAATLYSLVAKDFVNKQEKLSDAEIEKAQQTIDAQKHTKDKEAKEQLDKKAQETIASAKSKKNESEKFAEFQYHLIKYGSFMAVIAKAKTSDDISNAIEAFALPSGSSRIKRESKFNVSLNAYVGMFAGGEMIQDVDKEYKNTIGLTAPIGFATSWGGLGCERKFSLSAFVSVIDLGAITAFRFQNDTVSTVPTIELKNIISPGLFLSIGFPRCPISLNAGYQVGPNLRKVTYNSANNSTEADFSNHLYGRWSVSLVVDLPMLNLYSQPRKK